MKLQRVVQTLCVLLAVVVVACALKQLDAFKQKESAHDYAWIVEQTVSCAEVDDVCGQLHLIKGNACYQQAKQNINAANNYSCAVTELEQGIRLTKTWQQGEANLNRPQTYANLCESLRAWQDMERGDAATQLTQRLFETSQHFLAAEPAHPAAVYYNASARYTLLRPALLQTNDPQGLCRHLREMLSDLDTAMAQARGTAYQTSLTRLRADVDGARGTVAGCH